MSKSAPKWRIPELKLLAGKGRAKNELTSFNSVVLRLYCAPKAQLRQKIDLPSPLAMVPLATAPAAARLSMPASRCG